MKPFGIIGCILLMLLSIGASSQIIINGDFENNNSTNCQTNLLNAQYTSAMSNSWGFGNASELDIQDNSCGYATVPSNNWFVSLAKELSGIYDELSLEISSPLTIGSVYEISYFEFAADRFGANNIPLEIGLSIDSTSFGTLIHSSTPIVNTWTQQTFSFTAPNNGKYLTVRADSAGVLAGWNFVDKFEILKITGTEEVLNLNTKVYPNPAKENVTIEADFQMNHVFIYDFMGKIVLFKDCNETTTTQLNVSNLVPGYYILNVQGDDNTSKKAKLCIVE